MRPIHERARDGVPARDQVDFVASVLAVGAGWGAVEDAVNVSRVTLQA